MIRFTPLIAFIVITFYGFESKAKKWSCVCYKEIYQGDQKISTACRRSHTKCQRLQDKIWRGSKLIVPRSLIAPCTDVQGEYPWDSLGYIDQWIPSKKKDSFWSPGGCFLKEKSIKAMQSPSNKPLKDFISSWSKGQDVAITCDQRGISARKVNGGKIKLYKKPVFNCLVDNISDIIWFSTASKKSKATLRIIDLRLPYTTKPPLIAYPWPERAKIGIKYPNVFLDSFALNESAVLLDFSKKTITKKPYDLTISDIESPSAMKKIEQSINAIRFNDKNILNVSSRYKNKITLPNASCPNLNIDANKCEVGNCGESTSVPGTPFCRSMISSICGDYCHPEYIFFKKGLTAKKVKVPFDEGSALMISPSGRFIISAGGLYTWKWRLDKKSYYSGWLSSTYILHGRY